MIIEEKGMTKALKHAYGHGGYTVMQDGEQITIYCDNWYVHCDLDKLPRKTLALLVEHLGIIPAVGEALTIEKGGDPQNAIPEMVGEEVANWMRGKTASESVTMVSMIYKGAQLLQRLGGGPVFAAHMIAVGILEREIHATQIPAGVTEGDGLRWDNEGETVIVRAVRGATAHWWAAWERDIYEALEGVDLHKQEE